MTTDIPSNAFDAQAFLQQVTRQPGIYQMFGVDDVILYVGKAKNLKNRLASYFRATGLAPKTRALVSRIHRIEVTVTESETDALLLEQNLIKSQKPPYNILLRDDKSYPYIMVTSRDDFPRINLHRGAKRKKASYYGPFPNVGAVKASLSFLQKTFLIRQCEDSVFRNRSRPCLQYQIKRCTAPCVDLISKESYASDIRHASMFLEGKNEDLLKELADAMETAAAELDFEKAALYRDQITALRRVQSQQVIEGDHNDTDVVAVSVKAGMVCVHILFVRQGRILGSRSYYPKQGLHDSETAVLSEFLPQFYLRGGDREIPRSVVLSHEIEGAALLSDALQKHVGRRTEFQSRVRGHRDKWLKLAVEAAQQNLSAQLANKQSSQQRFEHLQDALGLDVLPERLECFDISHSSGELTVASCVVFDTNGPLKSDYRRFNIDGITGGDDYAAMEQALSRRYTRLQKGEGVLPDVLLIDGGKGQLSTAKEALAELGVADVLIVGVAKGTTRKAGFETLILPDSNKELVLSSDSPALHLIQHIRDEAHRFAITGHKQRRDKKRKTSALEGIPGVGAKRRRELLRHFGGMQEVGRATVEELSKVNGISKKVAEDIYSAFRSE
jgi:excinuclease ABC subunit C